MFAERGVRLAGRQLLTRMRLALIARRVQYLAFCWQDLTPAPSPCRMSLAIEMASSWEQRVSASSDT